jgi:shikimate dehydrogenase
MTLESLIGNRIRLRPGRPFGAILGTAPSKGARSPVLWRAAFAALGIDADFHPLDVAADRLGAIVAALKAMPDFIGGAVAVPYKETILGLLDDIEAEARAIGAVNALYRRDGAIVGANTDGAAALQSVETHCGPVAGRRVLQLGIGGAGRAVAVYLARAGAAVAIWNRNPDRAERFITEIATAYPNVRLSADPAAAMAKVDVLVNCTSAGFAADGRPTKDLPVAAVMLDGLKVGATVFDIIYQPDRTALLAAAADRGLGTLNGREMNLLQAAIAFDKAMPGADRARVAAAMNAAPR